MGLFGKNSATDGLSNDVPALDLDRTIYRLSGIGHYASVAALFMNAALVVLNALPKKFNLTKEDNTAKIIGSAFACATVIFGVYSSMVFSLESLYSKTILGMSRDDEFLQFYEKTSSIREGAFYTFVGAVLSFNGAFVMTLYLNTEGKVRSWLTTGAVILTACCAQHWFSIMSCASRSF